MHGWEQGSAGCSLNRERGKSASPREITLFWARRDDIMTDGDEDVGAGGQEMLSPTMAPRGRGHTRIHHSSVILYSSGLEK